MLRYLKVVLFVYDLKKWIEKKICFKVGYLFMKEGSGYEFCCWE